ncbi:MAG: hypothetical protein H7232_12945 [Aeromicrobium sp.]|nr:hypothetical protein [Burkholderiales bacterium]
MADASKPNPPLPDYFELLRAMTGGSPVGAGFGRSNMPGFAANPGAAFGFGIPGIPAMDPDELEKKIREFEVIHMWLSGQATAVELSIKAMQYQRDALRQMGAARESAGNAFSQEEMAKYAAAFNPTNWMTQTMPGDTEKSSGAKAKADSTSRPKRGSAKKR